MYLVTRPQPSANNTAAALRRKGRHVVVAPQMLVQYKPPRTINSTFFQLILVTSPQAAQALKLWHSVHHLPALAVGDKTAAALRQSGFKKVTSAKGDARDVLALVRRRYKPPKTNVLLACAPTTGHALARALRGLGYGVRRVSVYAINPVEELSAEAHVFLHNKKARGVLLYSARTARLFAEAVKKARLTGCTKTLTAYCLSNTIAKTAQQLPWKHVVIAAKPTEAALLKEITNDR